MPFIEGSGENPRLLIGPDEGARTRFRQMARCRAEFFVRLQRTGVYVIVLEPGGARRVEEVFMDGFPSSHAPPSGAGWTAREHVRALYAPTRARL